jgi:hypothetical protein
VIVTSWLIAFVEYCMAVPANRWGSAVHTTAQLKTIQEVVTLVVFAGFSVLYLKEPHDLELCNRLRLDRGGSVLRLSWPVVTPDLRLHLARYWDNTESTSSKSVERSEVACSSSRSSGGCRGTSAQDKLKYSAPRGIRSNHQAAIMGLDNGAADR